MVTSVQTPLTYSKKMQEVASKASAFVRQRDNEIVVGSFIALDVTQLSLGSTVSFQFGSTTTGVQGTNSNADEGWQIYGSNILGTLGTAITGWSCTYNGTNDCETDNTFTVGTNVYKYYDVTSTSGNVLLAKFDADVTATPLPATLPLFGSGLGVIGLLARRRKRKAQQEAA